MFRALLIAAAAVLLLAAKPAPSVDYSLGVAPQTSGPPLLTVEIRLRGDADGETRLDLPDHFGDGTEGWRYLSALSVRGASVTAPDPAHRLLRHRPGAKLVIRYQVRTAYPEDPPGEAGNTYRGPLIRPEWFAVLGNFVFAIPEGRESEPATFAWGKLPKGWRVASDLEHGAMGRPMSTKDIDESIAMGGARLAVEERPIPGGVLRFATLADGPFQPGPLADQVARIVSAERAFWNDLREPYFVALIPLTAKPHGSSTGGTGRGDGFVLYATPNGADALEFTIGHEHTHTWIPERTGRMPETAEPAVYWFSEGFTDFFTTRTELRAGLIGAAEAVARMDKSMRAYDASPARTAPAARIVIEFWNDPNVEQLPYQRGQLLALKWDEEIRRKTGGKADLNTAILRMRDHYQQFPAGQGPDVVTGLVSAVWVTAALDIRPDIAKYADDGAVVPLPDEMFDGCLQARVTISPGFDAGFDADASFTTKVLKGVKRRGPAWNSGLRDGMVLDAWTYKAGDMTRQIELTVRPPARRGVKARPRTIAYWPYGDVDTQTRALQLTPGMSEAARAACGKKIGGL
ncbi:hypothetical protein [Phenylobacterium sp.]|uniref:M61 family metallopeptidase n=1 Tax=Phenylobacterium sp. TaxID=1871053 RepID=UPI002600CB71|nr:hypothetical protein [Phenylobacterium sp.]